MATRLFVGNLPENISEDEVRSAFSSYGQITNLDLKSKSSASGVDENKKFAFVTIAGSNHDIESCIKKFSSQDFCGSRLYVTRARESFLERLQRERLEAQKKKTQKDDELKVVDKAPVLNLGDKLNPRKRKNIETDTNFYPKKYDKNIQNDDTFTEQKKFKAKYDSYNEIQNGYKDNRTNSYEKHKQNGDLSESKKFNTTDPTKSKKQESDNKRLEAMKKKSQEFKQKKMILKTGLTGVDKVSNKKIKFSDDENDFQVVKGNETEKSLVKKPTLFDNDDDEDSGNELNFEIKKQYEGKQGQKVLDLQSRYKSDKRFMLDERFIEDENEEHNETEHDSQVELSQADEKTKQLNILEDVLGVPIRKKIPAEDKDGKKNKAPKLGMLRFDPTQPEHAKFLAPIEDTKQESTKKTKKKKETKPEVEVTEPKPEEKRPEVSKEQFYKVSETLKEAIAQPTSFSLRSLFGNTEDNEKESKNDEANYIPLEAPKKSKVKNPLEPGEKNPFVYDSSESENEEENEIKQTEDKTSVVTENKAVWKESFFFGQSDQRLDEGLSFFTTRNENVQKERRELKSLMKKRIYNKERKDQMQMFRKKIGGRKKTMKKSFKRKN